MTLDTARAALGSEGALLLEQCNAVHDDTLSAPSDRLADALREHDYAPSLALADFETKFGGLLIPTEDGDQWREEGMFVLLGPFACVTSDAHVHPNGGPTQEGLGLVPVAYDPSDGIMYLDPAGRAYYEDTIADEEAELFAEDGVAAVARLLASIARDR